MGKLLGMLTSLVAAACVATVLAAAILVMYYAKTWNVTSERGVQALAILQGKSPESLLPPPPEKKKDADQEQPTYSQIVEAHTLKGLDTDRREAALRTMLDQVQRELQQITQEKQRVQSVGDDLQVKMLALQKSATSAGMGNALQTLQTLKPKQAKELLTQMLDKRETDDVVRLLSDMSDSKRAKIIAEFKTTTEMEQIGEVLRRIRQGQPVADTLDGTGKKLQPKGQGT